MPLKSGPPPETPSLVRIAAWSGARWVMYGVGTMAFALFVTLATVAAYTIGVRAPFLFCFGIIFGPLGLLLVPIGLYSMLNPTSNSALKPLGQNAEARKRVVGTIEQAIAGADSQHATLPKGRQFYLTPKWAVITGRGDLVVFERKDLLHCWVNVTVRRTMVVFSSRTYELVMRTAAPEKFEITAPEKVVLELMEYLQVANPNALFGYDARLTSLSDEQLIALMKKRRGDARPPG